MLIGNHPPFLTVFNVLSVPIILVGLGILFVRFTQGLILDSQQKLLLGDLERSANQLSATIKSSTRDDMMLNRPEAVRRIITTLGLPLTFCRGPSPAMNC